MPYPFPRAGLYYQDGTGVVAALYRAAVDVISDYGAQGLGTDDTGPILAAAAYSAQNGVPLYFPAVNRQGSRAVYGLSSPLPVVDGQSVLGDATSPTTGPRLLALAPMNALVTAISTTQPVPVGPQPVCIAGLTLDANLLCTHTMQLNGVWLSRSLERLYAQNALVDQFHLPGHLTGSVTISNVSGPAAITITQPDPGYIGDLSGTVRIALQCVVGGPLKTARWAFSSDGGNTFSTQTQLFYPVTNVCEISGTVYTQDTGIRIAWPARTYSVGETWSFTLTIANNTQGQSGVVNADWRMTDCWAQNCGGCLVSAGMSGSYSALLARTTIGAGTASCDGITTLVTGSGTTWITSGGRPGDFMFLAGTALPCPIACILDDEHLVTVAGAAPNPARAAVDWVISFGASFFQQDGGDHARSTIDGFRANFAPTHVRSAGGADGGIWIAGGRYENQAFYDIAVGGLLLNEVAYLLQAIEFKASIPNSHAIYLGPHARGGSILEPRQVVDIVGPGTPYWLVSNGVASQH